MCVCVCLKFLFSGQDRTYVDYSRNIAELRLASEFSVLASQCWNAYDVAIERFELAIVFITNGGPTYSTTRPCYLLRSVGHRNVKL